jgi:hypothetical protein
MALITYLTRIQFDHGAIKLAPEELRAQGLSKPLIVTDKGVVAAGILERLTKVLGNTLAPVAVYDGTPPNPTEAAARSATDMYKISGADCVIGLGGGSSMDLAKAVAVMATHPAPFLQYAAIEGGVARITTKLAPVLAIPTTSGTGSEVGRGAVIIFDDGRKLALISPNLLPKVAICDPELTLGLPAGLTAATGMDAMAHCVETFLSPAVNPPAEAIALDGAARAWAWIERATANGQDRDARWHMMMASMMGAMAFQKGLGAVHALSHPLGSLPMRLHHGTLNAVVMPAVLRFNASHVGDKYDRLRAIWGLQPGTDLSRTIADLNARLGLPANLRAMGVTQEMCEKLVPQVLADHTAGTNPRPISDDDARALFRDALG